VFVAKALFISFNHGFDTLSNCEVVLCAPLRLSLTPTLKRVGDSFDEATVFGNLTGHMPTNWIVFSVNLFANFPKRPSLIRCITAFIFCRAYLW